MQQWQKLLIISFLALVGAHAVFSTVMRYTWSPRLFTALSFVPFTGALKDYRNCKYKSDVSLQWYPPPKTDINNLTNAIHGDGVFNFIYDSSDGPPNVYNWCNMPRVNPDTYIEADREYTLEYVEVIFRHHKRTPYASNTFPVEGEEWLCDDEMLFYGGEPTGEGALGSAKTYWQVYTTDANPLAPIGFNGSCHFPQITSDGLVDSFKHGRDLQKVYRNKLEFLPGAYHPHTLTYRVTNNVITSQVASRYFIGMWGGQVDKNRPLLVQPPSIDSLEPAYSCPAADSLYSGYGPGSKNGAWLDHLWQSAPLKERLDKLSGVDPKDAGWHDSWDHYYDNLASRLCHQKPLPCNLHDKNDCVTMDEAEQVFRLGQYEYSFIYRDSPESLQASVASFGIWVGELAQNLRHFMGNEMSAMEDVSSSRVRFRSNTAHDGSIARLLSILQVNQMVWPGMGAEVTFELFSKDARMGHGERCYYLRVLWGGQILRSSHPALSTMDMVPVGTFLAYVDGLVGQRGSKVPQMCHSTL